tara:strand:+ start:3531 stop:3764 length:234 start_codon:yes stop_codon:yes gene_type:complete
MFVALTTGYDGAWAFRAIGSTSGHAIFRARSYAVQGGCTEGYYISWDTRITGGEEFLEMGKQAESAQIGMWFMDSLS